MAPPTHDANSPAAAGTTWSPAPKPTPPSTCFTCTRLNPTTFLIVEDDQWGEMPFIYAKICPSAVVLVDTGCGGAARDPSVQLTSLREFLETYPVEDNGSRPLNPEGRRRYAVVCTHCHYDHIGGIAQFTDPQKRASAIWASANDRGFIEDDLPTTSLCRFVGMETPAYEVTHWARDGERMMMMEHDVTQRAHPLDGPTSSSPTFTSPDDDDDDDDDLDLDPDLGLVVYHAPGHTPDELALWDPRERLLFAGDTLYEWAPIIFPPEGSDLRAYASTLSRLRGLVRGWNAEEEEEEEEGEGRAGRRRRVKMACGHVTSAADAEEFVGEVEAFLDRVRRGLVAPQDRGEARGFPLVGFEREDGRISFQGPKKLFDDFCTKEGGV